MLHHSRWFCTCARDIMGVVQRVCAREYINIYGKESSRPLVRNHIIFPFFFHVLWCLCLLFFCTAPSLVCIIIIIIANKPRIFFLTVPAAIPRTSVEGGVLHWTEDCRTAPLSRSWATQSKRAKSRLTQPCSANSFVAQASKTNPSWLAPVVPGPAFEKGEASLPFPAHMTFAVAPGLELASSARLEPHDLT